MADTDTPRYSYAELKELDRLDDAALRTMYDLEMSGEAFYLGLAAATTDEAAAVLLTRNGREEAGHARRLGRALAFVLGEPFVPPVVEPPGSSSSGPATVELRLLEGLRRGEVEGDEIYRRWAANEPDPRVARLLALNGREEMIHAGRVEHVMALLDKGTKRD